MNMEWWAWLLVGLGIGLAVGAAAMFAGFVYTVNKHGGPRW